VLRIAADTDIEIVVFLPPLNNGATIELMLQERLSALLAGGGQQRSSLEEDAARPPK
jgi:hypothetical protein